MVYGKEIKYKFKRTIHEVTNHGLYLKSKKETGFLHDKELDRLSKGEKVFRTVEELDAYHGFDTIKPKDPEQPIYMRFWENEHLGSIRDKEAMNQYPFSQGENISIQITRKNYEEPF